MRSPDVQKLGRFSYAKTGVGLTFSRQQVNLTPVATARSDAADGK